MSAAIEHAAVVRPCPGERVSGDATIVQPIEAGLLVAIVDVLGHGADAHELTHVIEDFLEAHAMADLEALVSNLHQRLRGTRGAAVGLCAFDLGSGSLAYLGVGNTRIRRLGASDTRLVSADGVLGQNMRTPLLQSLDLAPGDLVLLYTDGVSDRFSTADYPGILQHAPKDVARNVVDRFGKGHDDAACIAIRYAP